MNTRCRAVALASALCCLGGGGCDGINLHPYDNPPVEKLCDDGLDDDGDGFIDCYDSDCAAVAGCEEIRQALSLPQSRARDLDLLFVIDNSESMADEEATLRANIPALIYSLEVLSGGLASVHIGVTSGDLGTGSFSNVNCAGDGDDGQLLTGQCVNPVGGNYLIDVVPAQCEIQMDENDQCLAHTCSQANCAHEPTSTFVEDPQTGCPRCRNYDGESLADAFFCMANLGTGGCVFQQPLEAMRRALEPSRNPGFVREDALLGVVFIADEDDCSASSDQLYDTSQTALDSTLGPLTTFRCFEWGITCDENDRMAEGARSGCVPREDAAALLHPVDRYTDFLLQLKDPQLTSISAIVGPVTPSADGVGHWANVTRDATNQPELQFSCTNSSAGATPGYRLYNFLAALHTEDDLAVWAFNSICSPDFTVALAGVRQKVQRLVPWQCLPLPPKGCADIGVEYGVPRAEVTCDTNAQCLAQCEVTDVYRRGLVDETQLAVPPCLEILADGSRLEGNLDRGLAYQTGHPNERDAMLPVTACWHIQYQERCPDSNYAEIIVSRQAEPPARTFSEVRCLQIPVDEYQCDDGVDNDEDCRADSDDPCCADPANCRTPPEVPRRLDN